MFPGARAPSSSVLPLQKEPGPSSFHQCRRRGSSHPWLRRQSPLPIGPLPLSNLRQIIAVRGDIFLVLQALVQHRLFGIGSGQPQLRHSFNHVYDQMETIEIVENHHIKRRRGGAFFLVAPDMEEGTTTTPFDMVVLNDLDRFHLVVDVIERVPKLGLTAANSKQAMLDKRLKHKEYVAKYGDDLPEIRDWKWPYG